MVLHQGSQARFSTKAKHTITVSTLAAHPCFLLRSSKLDLWYSQSCITEEMNMGLSDKMIANGCPDVGTLRNWEFEIAAGCMAKVISKIVHDAEEMV